METIGKIRGVYAGKAVPYTRPGTFSAIDKQPVAGPVAVGTEGLQCDEQGDRREHRPTAAVRHVVDVLVVISVGVGHGDSG